MIAHLSKVLMHTLGIKTHLSGKNIIVALAVFFIE
jgi:hypothetical protein